MEKIDLGTYVIFLFSESAIFKFFDHLFKHSVSYNEKIDLDNDFGFRDL